MPPKTHNLVRLAEISEIDLSDRRRILLDKITDFNLQTRYPDYKLSFYKRCTEEYSKEYFNEIKELHIWLNSLIK